RVFAPIICFRHYIKLAPDLIIFNTHELILVSILYKLFFGTKLCYDVRENYYRNIKYGPGFSRFARPILAAYVRGTEYLSRPFINHYFVAEKNYEKEFTFTLGKSSIIENKFHNINNTKSARPGTFNKLLFTGTLAETTGVFEAIELAIALHEINPKISLKIVGRAAQKSIANRIVKYVYQYPWISLVGGSNLVNHSQIIDAISEADLGLIGYPKNKSTEGAIPTKIYEYLSLQLPIILQHNIRWEKVCAPYDASLNIDFKSVDHKELWEQIQTHAFYTTLPGAEVKWASEAKKLLTSVKKIKL
ncbi:MAG: hypothetical protein AAGG59_14565, partial [Bacteroidota bacterium]